MEELLEVVADAVNGIGVRARTVVGRYPEPEPDTVYVVVPHEYFVVTPESDLPPRELRRRTIGFCVEHQGTATFERNAALLPALGRAVDINPDSTAELRRRGFAVEHFQLGYSPLWDHWGGDPRSQRDIDVTYLGTAERRRSMLLRSYWRDIAGLRTRLLTPPHEMMSATRVDFLPGKEKFAHLARSRFIVNVHREQKQTLEWVRTLEAMCNGCVVLTEPSADIHPLVPGQHLVVARPESLGWVAAALAGQPEREQQLRSAAYEYVRELSLPDSARMLTELAASLLTDPTASTGLLSSDLVAGMRSPEAAMAVDTPCWDARMNDPRVPVEPPTPNDLACAALEVRRMTSARARSERVWHEQLANPVFADAEHADVDVVLVRQPTEPSPDELVADLLTGTVLPRRVLVGSDGVVPDPVPNVAGKPYELLVHELPLGRGFTRNALLERSAASWLLVLDCGMRASPDLLERLLDASTDGAALAHSPVGDPVAGLVGALPAEQRRLAALPYLGSGYLVRRSVLDSLGGWATDPELEGLVDHVFWRRFVAAGQPSALVQQVLLDRERPDPPLRPLDLDPIGTWKFAESVATSHFTPIG